MRPKQSQILDCFVGTLCLLAMTNWQSPYIFASEVLETTRTQVIVREHPKTGRPYVSIVPREIPPDPFSGQRKYSRPDYRLLDPKVKSGQIPYEGPYSDRTKIYIFAASLATFGAASGVAVAAAPAATGAAASGGAGVYAAAGTGVVAGSLASVGALAKRDPQKDDFTRRLESRLVKEDAAGGLDKDESGQAKLVWKDLKESRAD